jgi:hypothetical protein
MTMVRNQVRQQRETKEAFFRERGLTRDVIEEEPIGAPAAVGD